MIPVDSGPPDDDREVDSEIRFHLERRIEALVRQGWSRDDAEREAARRFGNVEAVRMEMKREARRRRRTDRIRGWLENVTGDAALAVRRWRRSPGFTAIVVVTLGLGIGATTAIFSVVDHVLLRPLPYPEPQQLGALWTDVSRRGGPADEWLSWANFDDARTQAPAIGAAAVWGGFNPILTGRGEPAAVAGAVVGAGMFSRVLRVDPALGRTFLPEDDVPGGPSVAVVSHGFWQDVLGADPDALGSTVVLNDVAYEVVGVLPRDFRPPFLPDARVWIPSQVDPALQAGRRGGFSWRALVRLVPGTDVDEARDQLATVASRLEAEYPESNTGMAFTLRGLRDDLVAPARTGLWVVLGSVALLFLVACVNVANLLLARATERLGEFSIRSALGAGRRRLVAQLTVESVGLALLGAALGVGVGVLGTRALVGLAPPGTPRIESVTVDLRVLLVTLTVSVVAGLAFGLVPALQVSGSDLRSGLRDEGRDGSGGRRGLRTRQMLVTGQVALAVVVLIAAGLLGRSFSNLRAVDMGFEPDGALTFFLGLPPSRYPDAETILPALRGLEERLAAVPGVSAVGTVSSLPLAGFDGDVTFTVEGRPAPPPGEEVAAWIRRVTPGYREAMGLRLVSGRFIEARDQTDGALVALVNETLAERHFPNENPVGRRLDFGEPGGNTWEIVGVVGDIRHFSVRDDRREAVYLAYEQVPVGATFLVVRGEGGVDPTTLAPVVRATVAEIDPALAAQRVAPMVDVVDDALAPDRFLTLLLGLFAGITLLLAVVGLYGIISYSVTARRRELGVRMALGAEMSRIGSMVVRRALVLCAVGIALGVALALAGTPLLRSLLFGIGAADPATFVGVAAVLLLVSAGAAALPAWRASRVDPVRALRSD